MCLPLPSAALLPLPGPAPLDRWLRPPVFAAVGEFIASVALSPALAQAAHDPARRDRAWAAHWPQLRGESPAAQRAWLCFLLACDLLALPADRGLALARQAADPVRWIRLFLCDHGLVDYAAMDGRSSAVAAPRTLA